MLISALRFAAQCHPFQAVIGLIASLALSLSAVLLTNGGSGNRKGASAMDSLDVLQATWLVGQNPAVLHRMLEIREPSLRHLREAGFNFIELDWVSIRK